MPLKQMVTYRNYKNPFIIFYWSVWLYFLKKLKLQFWGFCLCQYPEQLQPTIISHFADEMVVVSSHRDIDINKYLTKIYKYTYKYNIHYITFFLSPAFLLCFLPPSIFSVTLSLSQCSLFLLFVMFLLHARDCQRLFIYLLYCINILYYMLLYYIILYVIYVIIYFYIISYIICCPFKSPHRNKFQQTAVSKPF